MIPAVPRNGTGRYDGIALVSLSLLYQQGDTRYWVAKGAILEWYGLLVSPGIVSPAFNLKANAVPGMTSDRQASGFRRQVHPSAGVIPQGIKRDVFVNQPNPAPFAIINEENEKEAITINRLTT